MYGFTVEPYGTVQIDTDQSRFSGASAKFNYGGLKVLNQPQLSCGTGDFGFDCWLRASSSHDNWARVMELCPYNVAGGWQITFARSTMYLGLQLCKNGGGGTRINSDNQINSDTWVHVAAMGYNGTLYLFINGVLQSNTIDISGQDFTADDIFIGEGDNCDYRGWMDEIRFVVGACPVATPGDPLYISGPFSNGFTPPVQPYA